MIMRFMTIAAAIVLGWTIDARAETPAAKGLGEPGALQSLAIESGQQ